MNVELGSGGSLRGEAQTKSSSIANVYGMQVRHRSGFLRKKINERRGLLASVNLRPSLNETSCSFHPISLSSSSRTYFNQHVFVNI